MKFTKIIGSCDPKIVKQAEEKLSSVFTELSLGYDNKSLGTGLGGDPLLFQLLYPLPHYCDAISYQIDEIKKKEKEIEERIAKGEVVPDSELIPEEAKEYRRKMAGKALRTAATDGKRFYWAPKFVLEQSRLGLRIIAAHEALHAIYMHPQRRGGRMPRLFNIAVDYRVNFTIMQDLKARDIRDYPKVFTDNLGEYIYLEEYAQFLRNPFEPPPRLAHFNPTNALKKMADPAYEDPGEGKKPMYYADEALSDDMKRPENVYEYLLAQIPKCPKCGKLGKYKKPEEYKALEKKIKEQEAAKKAEEDRKKSQDEKCCEKHDHNEEAGKCCEHDHEAEKKAAQGAGEQSDPNEQNDPNAAPQAGKDPSSEEEGDCCGGEKGCSECGGNCGDGEGDYYYGDGDIGETLDDHVDSDISEEDLAKRMTDAISIAKKMGGKIPGGLEDELGILTAPKLTWEDFIRQQMTKKRNGVGRSNWLKPKQRPMFAGLYTPTKRDYHLNILAAYDTSGSMRTEDIALGISQLQVIDERGEISCVSWDTKVYWETMVKIKKADQENLRKVNVKGRGGTHCADVFNQYEEHCGKIDLILIMTDGYLYDTELDNVKTPPKDTQVMWLITSHNPNFKPPFGKILIFSTIDLDQKT